MQNELCRKVVNNHIGQSNMQSQTRPSKIT